MGPGNYFMQGNEACAEAALAAGCRFYAGYPITPSTEIMELMARRLPELGGVFVQMEDEIASIAAAIGASWTGRKAMTATSGPGFSLMQENIGYAAMTETPVVIVDSQRGGPATGQPTMVAQGDVMQARFGAHGDYEIIVLAPGTPQEMFDLTLHAFNLSEEYRTPVIVLADAETSHMRGKVVVEGLRIIDRKTFPEGHVAEPFRADEALVPQFPVFGRKHRVHVTGLTHDTRGYPIGTDPAVHAALVNRITGKIANNREKIGQVKPDFQRWAKMTRFFAILSTTHLFMTCSL